MHSCRFTTLVSFLHLVSSLQSSTLCSPTVCNPLRLLHSKVPLRFTNLRSSPILYSLYPLFRIASSPDAMGRKKDVGPATYFRVAIHWGWAHPRLQVHCSTKFRLSASELLRIFHARMRRAIGSCGAPLRSARRRFTSQGPSKPKRICFPRESRTMNSFGQFLASSNAAAALRALEAALRAALELSSLLGTSATSSAFPEVVSDDVEVGAATAIGCDWIGSLMG